VAENDRPHSAASEIQANTAPPDDTTVSVRAYAAHGQVPGTLKTKCELVFNIAFTLDANKPDSVSQLSAKHRNEQQQ
jgi:hypothetical protein